MATMLFAVNVINTVVYNNDISNN